MAGPVVAPGSPIRLGGNAAAKGGNWKGTATKILAWGSFALGIAASPLLAGTFVGGAIDNVITFGPGWAAPVLLLLLVVGVGVDLFVDGVPNRVALYCAMAWCSVARSVDGRLG